MRNGVKVIDSDGHVQEPADLWDKFMDKEFYQWRPQIDPAAKDNGLTVLGRAMIRSFLSEPGDDITSKLMHADVEGEALTTQ